MLDLGRRGRLPTVDSPTHKRGVLLNVVRDVAHSGGVLDLPLLMIAVRDDRLGGCVLGRD